MKKQQSADATNDKEFRTDERLFLIEQSVRNLVPKDELKQQLKMKASNERFIELREGLHKLQVMSISN
jgi:polyhydroxyalkanoate synthesis regulator phasin